MRALATLVTALVVGLSLVAAAGAQTEGRWIKGTPYFVSESDMQDLLEMTYDSAYCNGVARHGKRGEFPYEEYLVFDCTIRQTGRYACYDNRYKSVKAAQRGYYQSRLIRKGDCVY